VAGPDGAVWFIEHIGNQIGRITTAGVITTFPGLAAPGLGLAAGPDGRIWVAEQSANRIDALDPVTGTVSDYTPTIASSDPSYIAAGPDGAMWFTQQDTFQTGSAHVGRITTAGVVTNEYDEGFPPVGITTGADGRLWFGAQGVPRIDAITTSGTISTYSLPFGTPNPLEVALGADGAIWCTQYAPSGTNDIFQMFTNGGGASYQAASSTGVWGITAGPDGELWFTENAVDRIGRITDVPVPKVTSLQPSSGPPGTKVKVSASGFGAYERVSIFFVDPTVGTTPLGTVTTSATGTITARTVTIPSTATTGARTIQLKGKTSGLAASKTFTVT